MPEDLETEQQNYVVSKQIFSRNWTQRMYRSAVSIFNYNFLR